MPTLTREAVRVLPAVAIAVGWMTLGALGAIVVGKLLTGGINLDGLLHVKQRGGRRGAPAISAARVQLLLATLVTAGAWLSSVWATGASGTMPDIDTRWLYGIGASQGMYLASKAVKFLPKFTVRRQP